jgi:hypothetical protein
MQKVQSDSSVLVNRGSAQKVAWPMRLTVSWRTLTLSLVSAFLLIIASISVSGAQPNTSGNRAASAPRVYTPTKGTMKLAGIVDLAKAPKLTPGAQASASLTIDLPGDPLTPAQRQAYVNSVKANPQVRNSSPNTRSGGKNPAFVGGGVTPLVTKNVDGLTSAQVTGEPVSDPAIATDLSYVMEGVNGAVAIYRASTGALAYGPYAASSFFAPVPVYSNGDEFINPQMYYDVMRDRWVVSYLQFHNGVTYLDLAISVSNSPTQPAPGAQYYIYQHDTNFEPNGVIPSFCRPMTMGMDYWGIYFTCANFRSGLVGNTMIALAKAPLLSGGSVTSWTMNDGLKTATMAPAFATSPAIEEGVQDAEYFLSTDAGYGGPSSNMGLCSWTNLSNITTTQPTVTCQNVNLGLPYTDPLLARQTTTPGLLLAFGPKQVYYKAGRLYIAQSTALNGDHDGVYWAEVNPLLTTKAAFNPQHVNGAVVNQVAYYDFGSNFDLYDPTLMGTDENDISLVYNISGPALNPGIEMTGRKASDAYNTLGQGSGHVLIASGTHVSLFHQWSEYSSCAISLNSVTRGGVWCAAQYPGSVTDPGGWNTRLFNFRTE